MARSDKSKYTDKQKRKGDNGKIHEIEPAGVGERVVATGWAGAPRRPLSPGVCGLGFGAALPVWFAASLLRPTETQVVLSFS
jgi:hypothetical protein